MREICKGSAGKECTLFMIRFAEMPDGALIGAFFNKYG
jgi:hypothetical protein